MKGSAGHPAESFAFSLSCRFLMPPPTHSLRTHTGGMRGAAARMVLRVRIKQPTNHTLVLGIVLLRFALKKLHASLTQGNGHLHPFILKHKVLRARKKIRNDFQVPERFIRVFDVRAHTVASLSANSRPRKSE